MKRALLVTVLSLIAIPALAQNAKVAADAAPVPVVAPPAVDGTVRQGPLFLGGFVDRIKQSLGRKPADPVLSARQTPTTAQAAGSPTAANAMMAKSQREAYANANMNRNRQIAAAIAASADRDMVLRAQEIEVEKQMLAAQSAGIAVPVGATVAGGAAPAPVRVIDGTQKPTQGNKPIFNNYR
ncbi:MAG: hypothetical protein V4621_00940 [Pseudomonadota bacterium]